MRIHALPMHVANQIAAGEVIERPASVVKELLENALDAGASHIQIDIGFGGLNQITVSDNGSGIMADDLPLAVAAHATSKLRTLDDLYTISTMGFRGEALASIASVSRLTIQSRPHTEPHAMSLRVDGSDVCVVPCARGPGTTVDIRDLFFNAPVRKKFLKTDALEYLAIESVVRRFAFSEPGVALTLNHNGKQRLALPTAPCAHTKRLRLQKLLGKAFVDQAMSVDVTRGEISLQGWVSGTGYARSQQDKQWIYINRRMVRDKLMLHAIKLAYEHVLPPGRHPACLLYLTLSAHEVDVNVHPTKHEVRFNDPRGVHDLIRSSIVDVIGDVPFRPVTARMPSFSTHVDALDAGHPTSWFVLNERFVILFDQDVPYLVDMSRVRQRVRLKRLTEQPLPWAARPLLVPVSISVPVGEMSVVLAHQEALEVLGFVMEAREEHAVRIRAIPRDLPALDLQHFIASLRQGHLDQSALCRALLLSDAWTLTSITEEEKQDLMVYWVVARPFSLRLDGDRCQELVNA